MVIMNFGDFSQSLVFFLQEISNNSLFQGAIFEFDNRPMEESPPRGLSDLSSGGLPFPDMDFSLPTRKYQFNTSPLY
jgi:hypothetical protein